MKRFWVPLTLSILVACQSSPGGPPSNPTTPTLTLTPTSINVNAGDAPVTFVASVQNSTETVTWVYSGAGSITPTSGPATSYTPPARVDSARSETLTAVLGTTGVSATAPIAVYPADVTPPSEPPPTDPTDASDPTDPTDPTDSTDPTDPTDPTTPDPTDTTDPTDATDPTNPATSYTITVTPPTNGKIAVGLGEEAIDCGDGATDCTAVYSANATVVLPATPDAGWEVDSWGDDCSGTASTANCALFMDTDKTVSVTFKASDQPTSHVLTMNVEGSSYGYVTGQDNAGNPPFSCTSGDSPCGMTFDVGAVVTLAAQGVVSAQFQNWEGACSGSGSCELTMDTDHEVTAVFKDETIDLPF